ncbi:MAG: hypothetical protein IK090_03170 [Clostridia bacterium]|nr:hypothetical protein [Clostridia bacterium]
MKERKKTILRILLIALYVAVVIVLALVIPIVFGRDNDALHSVGIAVAMLLISPVIVTQGAIFDLLDKENREQLKQSIRDQKEQDRVIREEFRVPDDVETDLPLWYSHKARRTVFLILFGLGLIVSLGACAVFSFVSFNTALEIGFVLTGLTIVVYSFFVLFGRPVWGIVQSLAPFVSFFLVPLILYANGVTRTGVLVGTALGCGIPLYVGFLLLTVRLPNKRREKAEELYLAQFSAEHEGFDRFRTLAYNEAIEFHQFHLKDGKTAVIGIEGEKFHIAILSTVTINGRRLPMMPILYETQTGIEKCDVLKKYL